MKIWKQFGQLDRQIWNQLNEEIYDQVYDQLNKQLYWQIDDQFWLYCRNQLRNQLKELNK